MKRSPERAGVPLRAAAASSSEGPSPCEVTQVSRVDSAQMHTAEGGSGLIDIRALMAASKATAQPGGRVSEGTPVPVVHNIAVYPFGPPIEAAPPPAPVTELVEEPPRRIKKALVPALGALAVGCAALIAFFGRAPGPSGSNAEGLSAGAPGIGETANFPAAPLAPETGRPVAQVASKEAVEAPKKTETRTAVKPPQKAPAKCTGGAAQCAPTAPKPPTPEKTKPPTPPKVSPCNGDLRCEIERAAGK